MFNYIKIEKVLAEIQKEIDEYQNKANAVWAEMKKYENFRDTFANSMFDEDLERALDFDEDYEKPRQKLEELRKSYHDYQERIQACTEMYGRIVKLG